MNAVDAQNFITYPFLCGSAATDWCGVGARELETAPE
jgi:hypothetical protein